MRPQRTRTRTRLPQLRQDHRTATTDSTLMGRCAFAERCAPVLCRLFFRTFSRPPIGRSLEFLAQRSRQRYSYTRSPFFADLLDAFRLLSKQKIQKKPKRQKDLAQKRAHALFTGRAGRHTKLPRPSAPRPLSFIRSYARLRVPSVTDTQD